MSLLTFTPIYLLNVLDALNCNVIVILVSSVPASPRSVAAPTSPNVMDGPSSDVTPKRDASDGECDMVLRVEMSDEDEEDEQLTDAQLSNEGTPAPADFAPPPASVAPAPAEFAPPPAQVAPAPAELAPPPVQVAPAPADVNPPPAEASPAVENRASTSNAAAPAPVPDPNRPFRKKGA